MNTKQLFKKGITLSAAAALFTLGACQGKAADVSKEDAYAQLKSALTTTVETNELSVSVRGNFTSRTPVSDESDGSAASLSSEENKGTIDISLQMKTDEERLFVQQFYPRIIQLRRGPSPRHLRSVGHRHRGFFGIRRQGVGSSTRSEGNPRRRRIQTCLEREQRQSESVYRGVSLGKFREYSRYRGAGERAGKRNSKRHYRRRRHLADR